MGTAPNRFRGISKSQNLFLNCLKKWMTEAWDLLRQFSCHFWKRRSKRKCWMQWNLHSAHHLTNRHYQGGFPQTVRRECVGGRGIRWRHSWLILEGEVQRELMPMMPVLMYSVPRMLWSGREISVSCLWDLDASPDTGFYFWKLEGAWYGGFWFHWEIRRTSSQRFSLILNGRFCRSYCKL